jgi:NADH:ubiquinone oxidoreductase subunit E
MGCSSCQTDKFQELDEFIANLPTTKGALIAVLHRAQDLFGYLPKEVQLHIAHRLAIPAAKVYGVVSFYSFFNTQPRGEFDVNICLGTACFVRGAANILKEFETQLGIKNGETTKDGLFTINTIRCIGACGLAPVVMINEKVYGRVQPQEVKNIIEECLAKGGPKNE